MTISPWWKQNRLLITLTMLCALAFSGCQSNPENQAEGQSEEKAMSAETDKAEPVETTAEEASEEETSSEESIEQVDDPNFKSSLKEDQILSQSQVIKILKENGYVGGKGQMEVDGEILHCEFAGKRPSDGAKICIRKEQAKNNWVEIRPRLGTMGFSRW